MKSKTRIAVSLSVAFVVMLFIAVCVQVVMHKAAPPPEDVKSFAISVPGTEPFLKMATLAVWAVVAAVGAGAKVVVGWFLSRP